MDQNRTPRKGHRRSQSHGLKLPPDPLAASRLAGPMVLAGIVCTLSQEITLAIWRPFAGPTGTSVGNPLALDVIGAIVTCVMAPRTPGPPPGSR